MLYSTGAPECTGSAPTVGPGNAATQWTHTVPRQMPWTLPPSQRPFSRNMPINSSAFLSPHVPQVPGLIAAPTTAPVGHTISGPSQIGHAVNLPQQTGASLPVAFNDTVLADHTIASSLSGGSLMDQAGVTPYNVKLNQTMPSFPTTPTDSDGGVGLPRTSPRQNEASQKLIVYPGDPCTSSAPQTFSGTGESSANDLTSGHGASSQNAQRQFFPSTSYCAPRFKRKMRMGMAVSDGGTWSSSAESSDAVGGKIFVTERMVARMGDLSLRDRHQGELYEGANLQTLNQQKFTADSIGSEASRTLQGGTVSAETGRSFIKRDSNSPSLPQIGRSPFPLNNNNEDSSASQRYGRFGDYTEGRSVDYASNGSTKNIASRDTNSLRHMSLEDDDEEDEEDVDLKDNRTSDAPLLICNGVKSAIAANSSIEQRLAIDMMKKSTMAVVLWSPLKAQLAQSTASTLPVGPRSNLCNSSSDMDGQESASVGPDGRVPLVNDIAGLSGSAGATSEDVMEVM